MRRRNSCPGPSQPPGCLSTVEGDDTGSPQESLSLQKGVCPWTVSSSRISPPLESACSSASRPMRYSRPLSIPPSLVFRSKWAYEALTRGTWVRGHTHGPPSALRSEEHTSELQSRRDLVCR